MSLALGLILVAVCFLSYSNGANDNFKGVATLYGSGTATYGRALAWATATTFAGAMVAILHAGGLVKAFSGKGLVPDALIATAAFKIAVGLAAATTVLLATRFGFPVSTTHALTGALVGAGWMAAGDQVNLAQLGSAFAAPLLASPVVSLLLTIAVFFVVDKLRGGGKEPRALIDPLHYLAAGLVSFARGFNDAPKIAALTVGASTMDLGLTVFLVAIAMAIGGFLHAGRVARTMSTDITGMSPLEGFTANAITGLVVLAASPLGLPVSTTHVACGALFGIGAVTGQARLKVILSILTAWVTTLPVAALLGILYYLLVSRM